MSPHWAISGVKLVRGLDYYTKSYSDNVNVGTATVTVKGKGNFAGERNVSFKIAKAKQPMTVKANGKTASLKTLKKKAVTLLKAVTVKKAQGALSYKNASTQWTSRKLKVNAKNGAITIPRGTEKGTYNVKVRVTAKGNTNYKSGSRTATVKVVVT